MGAPHLSVIDPSEIGICGAETRDGSPCQNPPGDDGRCWLPGHRDAEVVDEDLPSPPDHLGDLGREYWRYQIKRCAKHGVLERLDLTVAEKYAEVAEILRRCWSDVQENGPSVPSPNGGTKTNPALSKYNSLMPDFRQLTKQIDGWVAKGSAEEDESEDGWNW